MLLIVKYYRLNTGQVLLHDKPIISKPHPCAKAPYIRRLHIDLGPLRGSSFPVDLWAGEGETQLSLHTSFPDGRLS